MRKTIMCSMVLITLFGLFCTCAFAAQEHVYVSNCGIGECPTITEGTGASCSDAHSISWVNNSSNWGTTAGKIGAGTTIYLCGTIGCSGGLNSNIGLIAYGSGSEGNPITIKFEPGAKMSAPTCRKWIDLAWRNYIIIDGGLLEDGKTPNGVIENTNNGTPSSYGGTYSYQTCTTGIGCVTNSGRSDVGNNIHIKNLTIRNLYVRVPNSLDPAGSCVNSSADALTGIAFQGSNLSATNVTVTYAGTGIGVGYTPGASNVTIDSVQLLGCNWGMGVGTSDNTASGFTFSNSVIDGFDVWETSGPDLGFHRNGIHFFTNYALSNVYIYNNRFGPGFNPKTVSAGTAALYFEKAGTGGLNVNYTNVYLFNNIFLLKSPLTTGWSGGGGSFGVAGTGSTTLIANNIMVSNSGGNNAIQMALPNGYIYNNIVYNALNSISIGSSVIDYDMRTASTVKSDHNIFYRAPGFNLYKSNGSGGVIQLLAHTTLAQWQNSTKDAEAGPWDANSYSSDPMFINPSPVIGTGDYHLQAASPAIGHGLNLSLFATKITTNDSTAMGAAAAAALLKDWDGNPRPGGATPWDIGIYQFSGAQLLPPKGLHIPQ